MLPNTGMNIFYSRLLRLDMRVSFPKRLFREPNKFRPQLGTNENQTPNQNQRINIIIFKEIKAWIWE